jgi:hypothetical protein
LVKGVTPIVSVILCSLGRVEEPGAGLQRQGRLIAAVVDDVGRPVCSECTINLQWKIYPCLTIQAIEKELA